MAKKKRKDIGLGPRGGATLRKRYARVMSTVRATNKCPSCASPSGGRAAVARTTMSTRLLAIRPVPVFS